MFPTELSSPPRESSTPSASATASIPSAIIEDTFNESASMSNYAKNLVFKLFAVQELIGSNCAGAKGKKSLEKDYRILSKMLYLKNIVLTTKRNHGECAGEQLILRSGISSQEYNIFIIDITRTSYFYYIYCYKLYIAFNWRITLPKAEWGF